MTGAAGRRARMSARLWRDGSAWATYLVVGLFTALVAGVFLSVLFNSIGATWFGGWLPDVYTMKWYRLSIAEFDLGRVLVVTVVVGIVVTVVCLVLGAPAAYVLARRAFPGKNVVMIMLLLPMLVPPITYGIPLATVLYRYHLAPSLTGVILANIVPMLPFVVLIMTPFFEQIDLNLERAARILGASLFRAFTRVLLPLALPGLLAAGLLVLVRTIALFELTFLTSGSTSQTLVVALYYAAFAAGIRPSQEIDAMAVVYMLTSLVLLLAALKFVNPMNMVFGIRR